MLLLRDITGVLASDNVTLLESLPAIAALNQNPPLLLVHYCGRISTDDSGCPFCYCLYGVLIFFGNLFTQNSVISKNSFSPAVSLMTTSNLCSYLSSALSLYSLWMTLLRISSLVLKPWSHLKPVRSSVITSIQLYPSIDDATVDGKKSVFTPPSGLVASYFLLGLFLRLLFPIMHAGGQLDIFHENQISLKEWAIVLLIHSLEQKIIFCAIDSIPTLTNFFIVLISLSIH